MGCETGSMEQSRMAHGSWLAVHMRRAASCCVVLRRVASRAASCCVALRFALRCDTSRCARCVVWRRAALSHGSCVHACVRAWLMRRAASRSVVRCVALCACVAHAWLTHACVTFLHCVFALRSVSTLRFCTARRFYIAFFRCKALLHYVFVMRGIFTLRFCDARGFCVAFFALRGIFTLRFRATRCSLVACSRCVAVSCCVVPLCWSLYRMDGEPVY